MPVLGGGRARDGQQFAADRLDHRAPARGGSGGDAALGDAVVGRGDGPGLQPEDALVASRTPCPAAVRAWNTAARAGMAPFRELGPVRAIKFAAVRH
ncbi:hypothetical protein GCM10010363_75930 [Streptomyces omiyaensis]|nr:hypothetical protein GCM10010363_75930 [Streptomyces omiyaensis]